MYVLPISGFQGPDICSKIADIKGQDNAAVTGILERSGKMSGAAP
jgi:hypothetical protein